MIRRTSLFAFAGVTLLSAPVMAQGGGCVLETAKPASLYGARGYASRVSGDSKERPDHMKRGMRAIFEDNQSIDTDNQVGRAYLLGKLIAFWLEKPPGTPNTTWEEMGLAREGSVNLYKVADSAFSIVEAYNPACRDSTGRYRAAMYSKMYNPAVTAMNARQYDTTIALAMQALSISPRSGQVWNLIAQAQYAKGDTAKYAEALAKVVEFGSEDPTLKASVEQAHLNLAILSLDRARGLSGDAQRERAREAEGILRKYLQGKPDDATAKVVLTRALQILGDTAAVREIYDGLLSNPENATVGQLGEAGVAAFNGENYSQAMRFFEAALKKNPYHRASLFNYANAASYAGDYAAATSTFARLFEVDPENADNVRLAARTWRLIVTSDSAPAALKSVSTDSAIAYVGKNNGLTLNVQFAPFTAVRGNSQQLSGVLQNLGTEQKSYKIELECLSATGEAVGKVTIDVPDVAAKTAKNFMARCTGAGISAYRYKMGM